MHISWTGNLEAVLGNDGNIVEDVGSPCKKNGGRACKCIRLWTVVDSFDGGSKTVMSSYWILFLQLNLWKKINHKRRAFLLVSFD